MSFMLHLPVVQQQEVGSATACMWVANSMSKFVVISIGCELVAGCFASATQSAAKWPVSACWLAAVQHCLDEVFSAIRLMELSTGQVLQGGSCLQPVLAD